MSNVVPIRRAPKVAEPEKVSAMVVAGSGGASTTTTTFGLATALRLGTGKDVTAVDSTSDGGNLLDRSRFRAVNASRSIDVFGTHMAETSSGMLVVGRSPVGQGQDPALVDLLLQSRKTARVYDVGTALRSQRLAPLITSGAALVVVAPARAEPLSRMREAMKWLMATYGADTLEDAIVVISHQMPKSPIELAPIRAALTPQIAGFIEVPFDPALARPGVIDHRKLAASTLDAWTDALDVLGSLKAPDATQKSDQKGRMA